MSINQKSTLYRTLEFAHVRVCLYELKIEKNINNVCIM